MEMSRKSTCNKRIFHEIDFCLATAPTAVGASFYSNSAPVPAASVRYDGILNTAVNRVPINFPFKAGDLMSITQF